MANIQPATEVHFWTDGTPLEDYCFRLIAAPQTLIIRQTQGEDTDPILAVSLSCLSVFMSCEVFPCQVFLNSQQCLCLFAPHELFGEHVPTLTVWEQGHH